MDPFTFLGEVVRSLITGLGPYGVLIGMILESSVIPIPSEAVLITAGLAGIDPLSVAVFGGVGSTIGAWIGYLVGKHGGRPLVYRYGRYLLLKESSLSGAERWFNRWGNWTVFLSRLIPFVPYKVFSITAGILKMKWMPFIFFTFLGSIPRCFLLGWIGNLIVQMEYEILGVVALALCVLLAAYLVLKRSRRWRIKPTEKRL